MNADFTVDADVYLDADPRRNGCIILARPNPPYVAAKRPRRNQDTIFHFRVPEIGRSSWGKMDLTPQTGAGSDAEYFDAVVEFFEHRKMRMEGGGQV